MLKEVLLQYICYTTIKSSFTIFLVHILIKRFLLSRVVGLIVSFIAVNLNNVQDPFSTNVTPSHYLVHKT